MEICTVCFTDTRFSCLCLAKHQPLAEILTVQNSPVLFGCRTGICGTCLVRVEGAIAPPKPDEQEVLEVVAPHDAKARLACQIDLTGDISITAYL